MFIGLPEHIMGNRNKPKKETKKPRSAEKIASKYTTSNSHIPDYLASFDPYKTTDRSKLSLPMQQIITKAYNIFGAYSAPAHFNLCTLCCVSLAEEQALRTLPLSQLPRQLIYTYNDSAKPTHCNKSEVAYLLPRILELIALDEEIMHSSELNLTWFSKIPYTLWTSAEKQILDDFALQYLIDQFKQTAQQQHILFIEDILVMFGSTGISLTPLLTYIAQTPDFYIIASVAYLIADADSPTRLITNAFASDHPHINNHVCQWLTENINTLKAQADQAILSPHTIAMKPDYIKQHVELGLCYLSDYPLPSST